MTIRSALSKLLTATIVLLLLVVVPLASVEAAGTIYVRPDGDDTNCDGTADVAYPGSGGPGLACAVKTIQKGVDLVDTGGTVTVAAGIYVENVVVAKAATISGAGAATTIIYPAVSNPVCAGSLCGSNIFLVQSSDVAIVASHLMVITRPSSVVLLSVAQILMHAMASSRTMHLVFHIIIWKWQKRSYKISTSVVSTHQVVAPASIFTIISCKMYAAIALRGTPS